MSSSLRTVWISCGALSICRGSNWSLDLIWFFSPSLQSHRSISTVWTIHLPDGQVSHFWSGIHQHLRMEKLNVEWGAERWNIGRLWGSEAGTWHLRPYLNDAKDISTPGTWELAFPRKVSFTVRPIPGSYTHNSHIVSTWTGNSTDYIRKSPTSRCNKKYFISRHWSAATTGGSPDDFLFVLKCCAAVICAMRLYLAVRKNDSWGSVKDNNKWLGCHEKGIMTTLYRDAGFAAIDIDQRRCVCHVPLSTLYQSLMTATANAIVSQVSDRQFRSLISILSLIRHCSRVQSGRHWSPRSD